MSIEGPMRAKRCQYGVLSVRCGAVASTKRQRPNGEATWDVCARHAAVLDRLRANIADHAGLLARLARDDGGQS